MENQHRHIAGYRDLTELEVKLMNEVKNCGDALLAVFGAVDEHLRIQRENAAGNVSESQRIAASEPLRWSSIARTHFQQGLMALTRAIAQPGKF